MLKMPTSTEINQEISVSDGWTLGRSKDGFFCGQYFIIFSIF
jgi:hypothetical protein